MENGGKPDVLPVDVPADNSTTISNSGVKITVNSKEIHISNIFIGFDTSQTEKFFGCHHLPISRQNSAVPTLSPGLYYYSLSMALLNTARRGAGRLRNLYLSLFTAFHSFYAGKMCIFAALTIPYRDISYLRPIISRRGISFSPLDASMDLQVTD